MDKFRVWVVMATNARNKTYVAGVFATRDVAQQFCKGARFPGLVKFGMEPFYSIAEWEVETGPVKTGAKA